MATDITITQEITIELDGKSPFEYVVMKQGDKGSRILAVSLLQNKQPYEIPTGCTARIKYYKPDGNPVLNDCTLSGSKILVTYTEQMLAAKGVGKGEIVLLKDGKELKSATYYTKIVETVYKTEWITSDKEFMSMTTILNDMDQAAQKAMENAKIAEKAAEQANEKTGKMQGYIDKYLKEHLVEIDETLSEQKKAAPANVVGEIKEEIDSIKEDLNTIRDDLNNITVGGVTSGFVRALQELFSAVAYWDSSKITNPSAKISALSSYIGGGSGNPSGSATVTGIAVVWSATSADVGTDPKTLITSVTAEYSDGTSKVVTSYSVNISSLVLGENNVVVSCLGFTDSKTITGNKVVNSLLSNLRSYKINVLLEPSYTIVSSGNTHTIDWNPDYTGNKIFQNGRAIGNCNIQNGKTYKVSTSEKITDVVHLYGFDVSVSGSEIDDVQSSPGTMVTTFQSGTKEVTFTASADFGYLRLAPVNCPITLYDLVVEEV